MTYHLSILKRETIKQIESFHEACSGCGLCTNFCAFHMHNDVQAKAHAETLLSAHRVLEDLNKSYDCSSCGYCQIKCPNGIDFKAIHARVKEDLYTNYNKLPNQSADKIVTFHQKTMFSKFFNHTTTGFKDEQQRKVFFPGCALIGYQPETVLATYEYLQNQDDNIGIMSFCCGKPTETIGKVQIFNDQFEIVRSQIETYDIKEIITACPNCHMTLKNHLTDVKITHISQAILRYGLPDNINRNAHYTHQKNITIHDPCPTRYEIEIHTAVRTLTASLGFSIRERTHSMEHTLCCGSGAMMRLLSPIAAEKYTSVFLDEFKDDEPIITYCQECLQTLNDNKKPAHHLLNLLFTPHYHLESKQKGVSFMKKWTNRYVYKNKVNSKFGASNHILLADKPLIPSDT